VHHATIERDPGTGDLAALGVHRDEELGVSGQPLDGVHQADGTFAGCSSTLTRISCRAG
jgi:hypothetical protein